MHKFAAGLKASEPHILVICGDVTSIEQTLAVKEASPRFWRFVPGYERDVGVGAVDGH